MILKFFLLALFGISMAHVEGVVVVYLRKALGILDSETNKSLLKKFSGQFITIEKTREAATIIMLIVLSLLVGATVFERLVTFFWTFAFWDLFYYASLYILIKWPTSLATIDILFLIPRPLIAPVWVPIGISSAIIVLITALYFSSLL